MKALGNLLEDIKATERAARLLQDTGSIAAGYRLQRAARVARNETNDILRELSRSVALSIFEE